MPDTGNGGKLPSTRFGTPGAKSFVSTDRPTNERMMNMRTRLNTAVIAVASVVSAAGLVTFANPANADVPAIVSHVAIQTADLDLGSPAGRATAERRIHDAADRVCGSEADALGPTALCRDKAIRDADQSLAAMTAAR
jgi:UrcA family protein